MKKENILLNETKVLAEQNQRFQAVFDEKEESWYLMVEFKETAWKVIRSKREEVRKWKNLDTLFRNMKDETGCECLEINTKFEPKCPCSNRHHPSR